MADLDQAALGARAEAMIKQLGADLGRARPAGAAVSVGRAPPRRRYRRAMDARGGLDGDRGRARHCARARRRGAAAADRLASRQVIDAGKYDGPLGVIAGILAVGHFAGKPPLPFGIDVLAFGDEEGSRFPATLASSAACAGVFEPETLALADRNGVTLCRRAQGLRQEPRRYSASRLQARRGRGLCRGAYRAGAGAGGREPAARRGHRHCRAEPLRGIVIGEAGHAGTVPMTLRRDALAGAAEHDGRANGSARDRARWSRPSAGSRSTPGAGNVIPGHVVLTVDMRSAWTMARAKPPTNSKTGAREIADRRQLE